MNSKKFLVFLLFFSGTFTVNGCREHRRSPKPIDPDSELVGAAEEGNKISVAKALKRGTNVEAKDKQGWTAIEWAGYRGDASVVALLLDSGAKQKNAALLRAAAGGPAILIELPAEPGKEAPKVNPELEGMGNYVATVKLLLDRGADIEARDEEGETPLMQAASYGRTTTAELLLERGAQIEARDNDENTALLMAACDCAQATMPDTDQVIALLLLKGANVNARNKRGETPLIIASSGGVVKTRIVKLLLDGGADARIKDSQGETALMIAKKSDVPDVVQLLEHWKPKDTKRAS